MVPVAGLEPAREFFSTDFKSVMFTISSYGLIHKYSIYTAFYYFNNFFIELLFFI